MDTNSFATAETRPLAYLRGLEEESPDAADTIVLPEEGTGSDDDSDGAKVNYLLALTGFFLVYVLILCTIIVVKFFGRRDRSLEPSESEQSTPAVATIQGPNNRDIRILARKHYVHIVLATRRVVDDLEKENDDPGKKSKDAAKEDDHQGEAPHDSIYLSTILSPTCSICLSDYQDGDVICWSHNPNCHHIFHQLCIEGWLIKHNECPCCRSNYMLPDYENAGRNTQNDEPAEASTAIHLNNIQSSVGSEDEDSTQSVASVELDVSTIRRASFGGVQRVSLEPRVLRSSLSDGYLGDSSEVDV